MKRSQETLGIPYQLVPLTYTLLPYLGLLALVKSPPLSRPKMYTPRSANGSSPRFRQKRRRIPESYMGGL